MSDPKDRNFAVAFAASRKSKKPSHQAPKSDDIPHPSDLMEDGERAESIADAIMKKRAAKKFAEGGMVDLEANNEEGPSSLDQLNVESVTGDQDPAPDLKENYKGKDDLITKIRQSIKARRGF